MKEREDPYILLPMVIAIETEKQERRCCEWSQFLRAGYVPITRRESPEFQPEPELQILPPVLEFFALFIAE